MLQHLDKSIESMSLTDRLTGLACHDTPSCQFQVSVLSTKVSLTGTLLTNPPVSKGFINDAGGFGSLTQTPI